MKIDENFHRSNVTMDKDSYLYYYFSSENSIITCIVINSAFACVKYLLINDEIDLI